MSGRAKSCHFCRTGAEQSELERLVSAPVIEQAGEERWVTRSRPDFLTIVTAVVAATMVLFQMASTQVLLVTAYQFQDIHLAFLLTLIFLASLQQARTLGHRVIPLVLLIGGLIATAYVYLNINQLQMDAGFPDTMEMVVGVMLIVLVVEATRRAWGWLLPALSLIIIGYYAFGQHLPGLLNHPRYDTGYIISDLSIGLSGVFGTFLSISANQVFLFVVFGALLAVTGINDLFFELGKVAGRVFKGGPAQTAIISSSLIGMVSGAAVANVATVGSFTIPYMKRVGFSPEMAGAIEANASTGGQIMPPVMGASAFLLATFVGVPYKTVMLAGIIPAVLFYWACVLGVQFYSVRHGIGEGRESINWRLVGARIFMFLTPLSVLIVLLFFRYSPDFAAFWAIIVTVSLSLLTKATRPTPREFIEAVTHGALTGARIGITLAIVGIIAETIITTGLGNKLAEVVSLFSGGNLPLALFLTMFVSLFLGMGVPTTAAYSLVAIIVIPSLVTMGVAALQAHFFAFYFAVVSALTPPVALASLTAAGIAGGDYIKTSINAFRLGIPAFVIPFLVVYNPGLLLHFHRVVPDLLSLLAAFVAITASTAALFNCGLRRFSPGERLLTAAGSVLLYSYAFTEPSRPINSSELLLLIAGLALLGLMLGRQLLRRPSSDGNADPVTLDTAHPSGKPSLKQ